MLVTSQYRKDSQHVGSFLLRQVFMSSEATNMVECIFVESSHVPVQPVAGVPLMTDRLSGYVNYLFEDSLQVFKRLA